jgi:hypothetical protein
MQGGFSSDEALDLIVKITHFNTTKSDPNEVSPEFNVIYEDANTLPHPTQVENARYFGYTDITGYFDREVLLRYLYPYGLGEDGYPKQFKRSYYDKRVSVVEEIWTIKSNQWKPTKRLTGQLRKGEATLSSISIISARAIYPKAFEE